MVNWCENKLTITGPSKSIKAIKQRMVLINRQCTDETSLIYAFFDFSRIIKVPKKLTISYEDWVKQSWGSHSNACNTRMVSSLKQDADLLSIRFDTIGSVPHLVIQKLIEHYPDCTFAFYYYELDFEADVYAVGEILSTQNGQSINRHYMEATDVEAFKNLVSAHFGDEVISWVRDSN